MVAELITRRKHKKEKSNGEIVTPKLQGKSHDLCLQHDPNTQKNLQSQNSRVCFRQGLLQLPKVFASAHHWAAPTVWIRCTVHHNWWCVHHDFSPRSQPGHRATLHHTLQWSSRRFLGGSQDIQWDANSGNWNFQAKWPKPSHHSMLKLD